MKQDLTSANAQEAAFDEDTSALTSEASAPTAPACFSLVTSTSPRELSKVFELRDGILHKEVSANLSQGHVERRACADLHEFSEVLRGLKPSQCLIYGVTEETSLGLTTDGAWQQANKPSGWVSRTYENFRWHEGHPGILMLDHDPQEGMGSYEPDDLVRVLREQVPSFADVDLLTWPSASSLIFNDETDDCLRPMKGCRVYAKVSDAASIPAWGRHVVETLWAAGHGVFTVSRAGKLQERGLFDVAVWRSNGLDFAAGAICRPPLVQRRGLPVLHRGARRMVAGPIPEVHMSHAQAAAARKKAARAAVADQASVQALRYADERLKVLERKATEAGCSPELARARAKNALQAMMRSEAAELQGSVSITVVGEGGEPEELTVDDVLRRRSELDGMSTLDPLEPEYDNHRVVGKLFLNGPVPRLHSFARGGTTYKLVGHLGSVETVAGAMPQTVNATLEILRACGDLYDLGDSLVTVTGDGAVVPISAGLMPYAIGLRVSYFHRKHDVKLGEYVRREEDAPGLVCKSVFELGAQRRLPSLNAVVTAPIIVDGRLLDGSGYDKESGLLVMMPARETEPVSSSVDDARAALAGVVEVFASFPFEAPEDRGVFLLALFTAVMRPGLRTAPGFAIDAPAQGTGKSLLSDCIAIVGSGTAPCALPHLHDDEAEIRKRLVSLLHAGTQVMIWDNIKGAMDSPVLASMLTSGVVRDRVLGESRVLTLPNRMLALFNGNNMTLRGELTRRILCCRLNACVERPYLRTFPESPRVYCEKHRLKIVRDVLTVIHAYQRHGDGFASDVTLGSFEEWTKSVLRPLLWAIHVAADPNIADPMLKLHANEEDDEELAALAALHSACYAAFGDTPTTAREMVDYSEKSAWAVNIGLEGTDEEDEGEDVQAKRARLSRAISNFIGHGHRHTGSGDMARELGKQLSYRRGRVVGGSRRFEKLQQRASGGVVRWRAAGVSEDQR